MLAISIYCLTISTGLGKFSPSVNHFFLIHHQPPNLTFTSDLSTAYSYEQISSIMRASSPDQLDVPRLYQEATSYFKSLVPAQPEVIATFRCDWAEDAMALSIKFHITEVQKPLIYYLIAHSELDRFPSWVAPDMVERIKQQVETIMPRLIDQFSPVIFTPPPTSHMECTDIIADRWMTLVITPALRDGGTGKPLDFLETMKGLEWEREGVCKDCVADKRDEWMEEQRKIWELLDGWISETQK
ncbi:hypothetical protein E1B28_010962 [Marasmius oreades]|uniref:Uncharacterized protein n=1 Tax=Marasmius oreades TaxID=181124 RepID=A0A9P7RT55_9AGAR|nr:uncharacterized protein E1B28_010962 [Marasmius oreades]KAG7089264.1 hypothetical protein E1B28_010962 [Marasmius oreades]